MAVYTHVPAEEIAAFLLRYDVGELVSAKGIAEGVENSNYLLDTRDRAGAEHRFILTLYEKRVDPDDLPFFIDLLDHLGDRGCRVPRFISDRNGDRLQTLGGRPACLIEFLSGISVTEPTAQQAHAAGAALAELHRAAADFVGKRRNALGQPDWRPLFDSISGRLNDIAPGLATRIGAELDELDRDWPRDLPAGVIHADLFPDNVLMQGDTVTGLIDFYFSCADIVAYDLAVTHGAWCFSSDGQTFFADRSRALIDGYDAVMARSPAERAAFRTLARGAALRFFLTRAYDWIHTPANAMVTRKDPLAYIRRLDFYATADDAALGLA